MYTVYILLCADGTLYTGITTNLDRRFEEHQRGFGSKYTRARGVKKVVYTERKRGRARAQKREAEIKKMRKQEKLALIVSI